MATGSWARLTAVATRTPSHPSSMASAASEAVPIPASRITGTSTDSRPGRCCGGCGCPGRCRSASPSGITAAQPTCWSRKASTGSSVVYGRTTNPSSASCSAAARSSTASGSNVRSSADDLELHPVGLERLAGQLGRQDGLRGRGAPGRVRQHTDAELVEQGQQRAPADRVHAAHRHGGHGRARLDQRPHEDVAGWSCHPCPAAAVTPAASPAMQCARRRASPGQATPGGVTRRPGADAVWWLGAGIHPTVRADHRRVGLGRRRGRSGGPQDLRRPPCARHLCGDGGDGAEHHRGPRRGRPRAGLRASPDRCGARRLRGRRGEDRDAGQRGRSSPRWPHWPLPVDSPGSWSTPSWSRPVATA